MDNDRNTGGGVVVKNEKTEATFVINNTEVLKQEPADEVSMETSYNVFDSVFDEVKIEICENSSQTSHSYSNDIDEKPSQTEAGLSMDGCTAVTIDAVGFAANNRNNMHLTKIKYEPIDKSSYYNYGTRDKQCTNTTLTKSSVPTCEVVIKPEPATLEQEVSLAIKQTKINLFDFQTIGQHEIHTSMSSAAVTTHTAVDNCNVKCENIGTIENSTKCNKLATFMCDICQCKFKRKKLLKKHIKSHTRENLLICNICAYTCKFKSSLESHLRKHTGDKPFVCNLCPYKSRASSNLFRHMRAHTGERHFNCNLCPYKAAEKSYLIHHLKTHTREKPLKCKLCPYECALKSRLTRHIKTHTDENPFVCKLCPYKCKESRYLEGHMRVHTGEISEKPFICKLCSSEFQYNCYLVRHMRTHTKEKPFSCEHCDYKCSMAGYLRIHMRTHTGEKPFTCNVCDYKSAQKYLLIRHMKKHLE